MLTAFCSYKIENDVLDNRTHLVRFLSFFTPFFASKDLLFDASRRLCIEQCYVFIERTHCT